MLISRTFRFLKYNNLINLGTLLVTVHAVEIVYKLFQKAVVGICFILIIQL